MNTEMMSVPPPSVTGPVTRTDIVRYQGASGDMHEVHHDHAFARAQGFAGVFSVGMYQAGLLGSWATEWLGPPNVRSYRARFKDQVWPGDVPHVLWFGRTCLRRRRRTAG